MKIFNNKLLTPVLTTSLVLTGAIFMGAIGPINAQNNATPPAPPTGNQPPPPPAPPVMAAPAPAPAPNTGPPPPNMPPPPPMGGPQEQVMQMPPQAPVIPQAELLKPGRNVTMPAVVNVSGIAAIVNGQKITNTELAKAFLRNGGQSTLSELILTTELEQAAAKAHITVTPDEVSTQINTLKQQILQRFPGETWSEFLAGQGFSEDYVRSRSLIEIYAEKLALAQGPPFSLAGKRHVYHILIATTKLPYLPNPHTDADALKLITQIRADIMSKKLTFQQAATKYSEDQSTAVKGGDLDWVSDQDPLDDAFKKATFMLAEGSISEPVKSQFGYHLILVDKLGEHATPAELKKESAASAQERARPLIQQYIQQIQASAVVQNLLIPIPPKKAAPMFGMPQGMGRPTPGTIHIPNRTLQSHPEPGP